MTDVPEDLNFSPRGTKSKQHLGPVFFGECQQFHPPLHELDLGSSRHIQHSQILKETIENLFLPKTEVEKRTTKKKEFHPYIKLNKIYPDPYPHKCPGARKAFVPELRPPIVDLGKTTSVIEGETSMEVSLYLLKKVSSKSPEAELKLILPSDLREERLKDMPYKKRIAHPHFPKRFAPVTVIGPAIPASLTITKLLTKRKTYIMNLHLKSQGGERVREADENEKKTKEEITEAESGVNLLVEEEMEDPSESSITEDNTESDEMEEGSDFKEFSEGEISPKPEELETMQETEEEETNGVNATDNDLNEKFDENQEEE